MCRCQARDAVVVMRSPAREGGGNETSYRELLAGATIETKNNVEQPNFPQEEQVPKLDLTINVDVFFPVWGGQYH